jgi:hypothetical protein
MKRAAEVVLFCLLVAGCNSAKPDREQQRESLTRQQKDSVIANSKLPGARGVQGALDAAGAAAARQQAADTIH